MAFDCPGELQTFATLPEFEYPPASDASTDHPLPATVGPVTMTVPPITPGPVITSPTIPIAQTPGGTASTGWQIEIEFDVPEDWTAAVLPFQLAASPPGASVPSHPYTALTVDVVASPPLTWPLIAAQAIPGVVMVLPSFEGPYPTPAVPPGRYRVRVSGTSTVPFMSSAVLVATQMVAAGSFGGPDAQPVIETVTFHRWGWECEAAPPPAWPSFTTGPCLGNSDYAATIMHRATTSNPDRLPVATDGPLEIIACDWSRSPDVTTSASMTIAAPDGCAELFTNIDPSVLEIELHRGDDTVWSGPISEIVETDVGQLSVVAADVSSYVLPRRAEGRTWTGVDASTVAAEALAAALALDDPGEITIEAHPTGVGVSKTIDPAELTTVEALISELSQAMIDWTVVDRTIIIGGRGTAESPMLDITLVEDHFDTPPVVSVERGVTRVIVKGADGVIGMAGGPRPEDGVLIERIIDDTAITTQADANRAAARILDVIGEPVVTIDGSNTTLRPSAPFDIQTLIPGVEVNVSLGRNVRYDGVLAIGDVSVSYDGVTETVSVSLVPTSGVETL